MKNFEDILKNLPDSPGVYIMKDKSDEIIYVGKAISLKKRVRQYFQTNKNQGLKVASMVKQIHDLEYIMVENEVEALVLEANLIKKNRPKYNILLRDDKQYPYIKVTINERYPRVLKTRLVLKDGAKYYGPFPSANAVNEAIEIFHDIYQIRDCKLNLENKDTRFRPCLNYHIGRCLGPCLGNVDEELYKGMIEDVLKFLNQKDDSLITNLEEKMRIASSQFKFEEAAKYRDQVLALRTLHEKQRVDSVNSLEQDVIAMARGVEEVVVQVFFIREGKILGREHYIMEDSFVEDRGEILSSFLKQFYIGSTYIPKEVLVEEEIEDRKALELWLGELKGNKVSLLTPKRGEKADLIHMVKENALEMLNKYGDKFLRKHRENLKGLEELQYLLQMEERPDRIEAFDISNISGADSVGSMVVFEKGEPKKSDYRRFKIRTTIRPDDYKSMEEVLNRRFIRGLDENGNTGFSLFPDLIMIDGGKGQVNRIVKLLDKLGVDIPVCGLVKDDNHKTRGLIFDNIEISPNRDSFSHKLMYKIQEEAHRFAISYHRSLRSKDMFKSELDNIPLIGEKRKVSLLEHFKTISNIKKASIEELKEVEGMNIKSAESIYQHFRKREE